MARAIGLGLLVGFTIAASPGPIFLLTVRRTLDRGWRSGLTSGLGVATGDATYAAFAAFGVAAVTGFLLAERRWIGLVGGIAIALIGLRTLKGPHPDPPHAGNPATLNTSELGGAYGSMVALTLSNPATILSFTAVFAGLGPRVGAGWRPALGLVVGVMLGSALWWVVLTAVISLVRERLTPAITRGITIASGVALIGLGVVAAVLALSS